ncbi:helix-turn-helix domain-containing protein [Microbacterium sp. A1-JK]|uniref:helix-turn-helix domain-containing protein n=1 Tax=Microbacterium sp. A1-JK TaxID=3177516 RepID=UPI00388A971B
MATDIRSKVAAAVLLELSKADRTKRWLSDRTGIPYSTLDRKLRAHVDLSFTELFSIAEALGVEPWRLTPEAFMPAQPAVAS